MKKRNPILVFLFGFITIFIYSWYWSVKTKGEMNKLGQKVPTAFIWLIPIVGTIWWFWKYSEAVENITNKELSKVLSFIVLWVLGPIGNAIVQDYFNNSTVSVYVGSPSSTTGPPAPAVVSAPAPTAITPSADSQSQPATEIAPTPPTDNTQPPSSTVPPNITPTVSG